MLEAAARRPRDRGELAERLRTAGSERSAAAVCPPVVGYGAELQARAAAEVEALPEGSAVAALLSDYAVMRDQARVCEAEWTWIVVPCPCVHGSQSIEKPTGLR